MGREFFKHWPELLLLHFVPDRENYLVHNPEKTFKQTFNDCFTFKFEKGFFDHAHPSASSSCQDDSTSWLCFSFFGFCFFTHLIIPGFCDFCLPVKFRLSFLLSFLLSFSFQACLRSCSLSWTQKSSFSVNSFFQIGASAFIRSMASLRAGKSSVL